MLVCILRRLPASSSSGRLSKRSSSSILCCSSSVPSSVFRKNKSTPLQSDGFRIRKLINQLSKILTHMATARIGKSGRGFQATHLTASSNCQTLRHLPVSTSHIRTDPSVEPLKNRKRNEYKDWHRAKQKTAQED